MAPLKVRRSTVAAQSLGRRVCWSCPRTRRSSLTGSSHRRLGRARLRGMERFRFRARRVRVVSRKVRLNVLGARSPNSAIRRRSSRFPPWAAAGACSSVRTSFRCRCRSSLDRAASARIAELAPAPGADGISASGRCARRSSSMRIRRLGVAYRKSVGTPAVRATAAKVVGSPAPERTTSAAFALARESA